MRFFVTLALFSFLSTGLLAAQPIELSIWPPGRMPPGNPKPASEKHLARAVTDPTITVQLAPGTTQPTPAVLISPGGSYTHHAFEKEGTEIASWFNTLGITGITLKYRVPNNRDGALQDVQRALRLVRARAKEWSLDPNRIGVMGFSAGGHLSVRLSTNFEKEAYEPVDTVDRESSRPDFTILVYPAYLATSDNNSVSPELAVSGKTPPTFIAHSKDDFDHIIGSQAYSAALGAAGVPYEFFLVAEGGHGYGLRSKKEVKVWPEHLKAWLIKTGVLGGHH